jgi:acid phosphatase type 7
MGRRGYQALVGLLAATLVTLTGTRVAAPPAQAAEVPASPVILTVGDMACDAQDPKFNGGDGTLANCAANAVSGQMAADSSGYLAVVGLGDYQYDCGDPADYQMSYNPTYGVFDSLMNPVVGNIEYRTGSDVFGQACPTSNSTAQSYFAHFGAAAHQSTNGHYSFDVGSWHLIGLNANCGKKNVGGCATNSPQTTWLKNDLAAVDPITHPCIAAFWHQPLWSGRGKNAPVYQAWWNALYAAHGDVVLNGHIHNYQRFPALDPTGTVDPVNGITEYIAGTGGESLSSHSSTLQPQAAAYAMQFGYLRMTLLPTGWSSQFMMVDSKTGATTSFDPSAGSCHA